MKISCHSGVRYDNVFCLQVLASFSQGAFLQRVCRDVHEQKCAPATKQIVFMNIAATQAS